MNEIFKIFNTFDVRFALVGIYLWLLFGFLSSMISCDVQELMNNNIIFRHGISIIAFYLLFMIFETGPPKDVFFIWKKTLLIYFVFLLMIKNKWYFSIPILLILVADQSLKHQITYLSKINSADTNIIKYQNIGDKLYILLIVLIVCGFIHYTIKQYTDYGSKFSIGKLLFTSTCKNNNISS